MLTFALCFCLALVGSAQVYSPSFAGNYGYPGAYGNSMGGGYMGSYSPYGSPLGMSGYPGGMGGLYGGHNMMYGNMGSSYGYPYNRFGSSATNKPFFPAAGTLQPVRSQSYAFIGGSDGNPNC